MAVRVCLIERCLIWEIEHRAASLARDVTISTRLADTLPVFFQFSLTILREAQFCERRARRSAADIRNDVKLERGYSGEI